MLTVQEMLNHDEGRNETKYPDLAAMIRLEDDINELDVQKVKLVSEVEYPFLLPCHVTIAQFYNRNFSSLLIYINSFSGSFQYVTTHTTWFTA